VRNLWTTTRRAVLLALASAAIAQGEAPNVHIETWPDGSLRERYAIDERGEKHGHLERWTATGIRTLFEVYAHGRRHGSHREWNDAGILICSLTFQNDQLHGLCETFHGNSRVATTGSSREGKRNGKWMEMDPTGERRRTAEYRDGVLHGTLRIQWKSRVVTRQTWKNGELIELDDLTPFPVPREILLAQLRQILGTEKIADPADAKSLLRQDALLRLRAYRHLCRLPHAEMMLWPQWNELCDAAAEVCRKNGGLNHHPPKPAGMDDKRFQQGYEGAGNSNLHRGGSATDSVDGYMDDSDPSNIDRIGHRRWCLNPTMKKTAFGMDQEFNAMWSMDSSGAAPKGLDAVYYPPCGYVPIDLFSADRAFSITAMRGRTPNDGDLRAIIRPLDDDYLPGESMDLDNLHVAPGGFGAGTCLVFRAKELRVAVGKRYLVEVSTDGGKTNEYRYVVEFCEAVVREQK